MATLLHFLLTLEDYDYYNLSMTIPIISTKLYVPPVQSNIVLRPRLIERLNEGLRCKLVVIPAPAGFGKTTLVRNWLMDGNLPYGWLSLDEADNDPSCFLTYLIAAMQTIAPNLGEGASGLLQAPQPLTAETILTALLHDIAAIAESFVLVLDDYHEIDSRAH